MKSKPTSNDASEHKKIKPEKYLLYRGANAQKYLLRLLIKEKLRTIYRVLFPVGSLQYKAYHKIVSAFRLFAAEGGMGVLRRSAFLIKQAFSRTAATEYSYKPPAWNLSDENNAGLLLDQGWRERTPLLAMFPSDENPVIELPEKIRQHAFDVLKKQPISVSVVIATWNRSHTICDAINSALKQSYLPREIIVSDDGSQDDTIRTIREKFSHEIEAGILTLLEGDHAGVSHARNRALDHVRGDVVAYLDSDNVWQTDYLLVLAAIYSENDEIYTAYAGLYTIDLESNSEKILFRKYDRRLLLTQNYIDLNVFSHRREVAWQQGVFDIKLTRLVDWELIIRYTRYCPPARIPYVGGVYRLDKGGLDNITYTEPLNENLDYVYSKHVSERLEMGLVPLRLGYVLWDFPALSQTFVMNELRWLVEHGYDVNVYYRVDPDQRYPLDFSINAFKVNDAKHLSDLLVRHQRNYCHSHFVYPAVTLLTYPVCIERNIPFTFMPHAVDLFHQENSRRNKISEISQHALCQKVFVYGEHHKEFLVGKGVPKSKIAFAFQAVDVSDVDKDVDTDFEKEIYRGVVIARFIEKKGITYLLQAAKLLEDLPVRFDIYGFGPLLETYEEQIRELGLKNLTIHSELRGETELNHVYAQADFLVVPSVVAENGDMDGFPTVILEAMARGIPVIATKVSAIPDYLVNSINAIVVNPASSHELENAVRELVKMSASERSALVHRAKSLIRNSIGVEKTMHTLLDFWLHRTVDIIVVTYNTKEYDSKAETFEIIRRILEKTTSPYNLYAIDNGSDYEFVAALQSMLRGIPHVVFLKKMKNIFLGPATNLAIRLGRSKYAIYVCSKEGFVKSHGWDQSFRRSIQHDSEIALAGHLSFLPKYLYGRELITHPEFVKFRNKEFALENPLRVFKHVQGGIFIVDREKMILEGGYNNNIPQANMDVELSYYFESKGYKLESIQSVASITTKTRPLIRSLIDERTIAAHPFTIRNVEMELDKVGLDNTFRCNICGWIGEEYISKEGISNVCPACFSTSFGRLIFRVLASEHHIYRGGRAALLCGDVSLNNEIARMFSFAESEFEVDEFRTCLMNNEGQLDCIIIDSFKMAMSSLEEIWLLSARALKHDGIMLFSEDFSGRVSKFILSKGIGLVEESLAYRKDFRFKIDAIDHQSLYLGFGSNRIIRCTKYAFSDLRADNFDLP